MEKGLKLEKPSKNQRKKLKHPYKPPNGIESRTSRSTTINKAYLKSHRGQKNKRSKAHELVKDNLLNGLKQSRKREQTIDPVCLLESSYLLESEFRESEFRKSKLFSDVW